MGLKVLGAELWVLLLQDFEALGESSHFRF